MYIIVTYIHQSLPLKTTKCKWLYQSHGWYGIGSGPFFFRTCPPLLVTPKWWWKARGIPPRCPSFRLGIIVIGPNLYLHAAMVGTHNKDPAWVADDFRPVTGTSLNIRIAPVALTVTEELLLLTRCHTGTCNVCCAPRCWEGGSALATFSQEWFPKVHGLDMHICKTYLTHIICRLSIRFNRLTGA